MERATELESRNLCRVCLNQDEENANFLDIFQTSGLTMELLASGNVEVCNNLAFHGIYKS